MALIHVMHCREIAALVDSGQIEHLNFVDRQQVRVHMWVCWHCRFFVRQIQWLRMVSRATLQQTPDADPDLEARILRKLSLTHE